MNTKQIAKVVHEANRALCQAFGDNSQQEWKDAEEWQRKSAIEGVEFIRQNPNASSDRTHISWMAGKLKDGWKYGPVKDLSKKEHPCLVPYEELLPEQKAKDYIFAAIVRSIIST